MAGRPTVWTAERAARADEMRALGRTTAEIAVELGVGVRTVTRHLGPEGAAKPARKKARLPKTSTLPPVLDIEDNLPRIIAALVRLGESEDVSDSVRVKALEQAGMLEFAKRLGDMP